MVLRVPGCGRRHSVIQGDSQLVRDRHPLLAELLPDFTDGGCVVVAQHHVRAYVHDLADSYAWQAGRAGYGFLSECLGRLTVHLSALRMKRCLWLLAPRYCCERAAVVLPQQYIYIVKAEFAAVGCGFDLCCDFLELGRG